MIRPIIQTNVDRIGWSFENSDQVTGTIEIELSYEKLTAPKTCPHGKIIIPNRLTFFFRIDPDVNDMELYLGIKPDEPPTSKKAYSFIEDNVASTNKLIVLIDKEKIVEATLNGSKLIDITPYSWEHKVNHFETHKKILEDLFGNEWFTSDVRHKERHPAYIRWALCKDILEHGFRYPDHIRFLPEITTMLLDNYALLLCSRGDADRNILGNLSTYGSASAIKRIRSEIVDPDKYGDVMLELTYAAWHISRGHQVKPTDEQGTADFEVLIPGHDSPIYTDCKRIRKDTNDSRFCDAIKKANKQIKRSSKDKDCFGLVAIDISDKTEPPKEITDKLPAEVQRISLVIQDVLKKHYKSISAILLFWNEFSMLGNPLEQPASKISLRRRSYLIRHIQPSKPLPDSSVLSETGNTVEFNIHWQKPPN
jgi:hypothetical protein